MATTILKALPNSFYTEGRGVAHFYAFTDPANPLSYGPGVRLGDMDALTVTVEATEGEARFSNEYDVKTEVLRPVDEISCSVSMTLAQLTTTAVQAALMGKRAAFAQVAQANVVKNVAEGTIVWLGGYDVEITSVVIDDDDDTTPAIAGTDYIVDAVSGQLEAMTDIIVTYDIPAVSDRFKVGVASGVMPRGMLIFRSVTAQGQKKLLRLHDVQLKPSGGLDMISDGIMTPQIEAACYPVAGQEDGFAIGIVTDID